MPPTTNSHPNLSFVRLLGSMERFLWAADFDRATHFAMAAQVEGQMSVEAWRTAIDAVQRRHPLCSACIDVDANQTPYFRHVTDASIPLRVVPGNALRDWSAEIERELAEGFRMDRAPLMRAVLIHEADRATLILVAHHSIADGLAMTYLFRDILLALSGAPLPPSGVAPSQEQLLGLTGPAEVAVKSDNRAAPASTTPNGHRQTESSLPQVDYRKLTPERTAALRERARQEGTTLHGALSAAFVLAGRQLSSEWNQRPIRVLSPIDTRKMLDRNEDCVLRVGVGLTPLDPEEAPGFWSLARLAKRSLAEAQTRESITAGLNTVDQALLSGPELQIAAHLMENVFIHDILLTNLGSLPYETTFGNLKLEALWGPAVMGHGARQTIGVVTVDGALHLSHTSYTPLPALLQTATQILNMAC